MNQMLIEHHIAQYNILLIEDLLRETKATYGTRRPLVGTAGGHRVAQRADERGAT